MFVAAEKQKTETPPAVTAATVPLESCLGQLECICREFHIENLMPQVAACREMLKDETLVDVVVIGRFKAGKSSFLNHLLGLELLPVSVLPVTAIVTRLCAGARDRAVVRLLDGEAREVPLETLADYIAEQNNPGNVKGVALVDVELIRLTAFPGIRFVDTPGLGSIFTHNTRTSQDWLPRIGAAFLAVSVDHPLSEHDVVLLKELSAHTPEISILVTKTDLVSERELADVSRFIREQVEKNLGRNVPVIPYSIRPGHEPMREGLRQRLLDGISAHHEEQSRRIIGHKIEIVIEGCRAYLQVARAAAEADENSRRRLHDLMLREKQGLGALRREMRLLIADAENRLREEAANRFMEDFGDLVTELIGELRGEMKAWTGPLDKTARAFEEWMRKSLRERLATVSAEKGENLLVQFMPPTQAAISRMVRGFQDRLAAEIETALDTKFKGAELEITVEKPEQPDIRVDWSFDIQINLLWFLIPMSIFRPLVNRHFVGRMPWEVEKNLRRTAVQWVEALVKSMADMARQAEEFMNEELTTLERLLDQAEDRRPACGTALGTLDGLECAARGLR